MPIGDNIRATAMNAQTMVERSTKEVRWVRPENIHLTLKYLGDSSDDMPRKVASLIKNELAGIKQFSFKTTEFGAFPSNDRARVLWLGVAKESRLDILQARIETALIELGFRAETRDFHPHITIGRLKRQRSIDFEKINGSLESEFDVPVKEVNLYASYLSRSGARYEVVEKMEIVGKNT